jgi:hypothetical protein
MALKLIRDTVDGLPEFEARHYERTSDGKFKLVLEDGPVELGASAKLATFRENNIALLKENDALKTEQARLTELVTRGQSNDRVSELEAQLEQERAARVTAEETMAKVTVRDTLRPKALAAGAIPGAVDILLEKAAPLFTVANGAVVAQKNTFSRTRPGEAMTPDEWLLDALITYPFLFHTSKGGGAGHTGGGTTSGARELRDPSPQDLGRYADDIKSGAVRVVHSS